MTREFDKVAGREGSGVGEGEVPRGDRELSEGAVAPSCRQSARQGAVLTTLGQAWASESDRPGLQGFFVCQEPLCPHLWTEATPASVPLVTRR